MTASLNRAQRRRSRRLARSGATTPGGRLLQRACRLLDAGRVEEAAPLIQRAVALLPDDAHALYVLGATRLRVGDYRGAAESADRALRLAPGHARAHQLLGRARLRLEDPEGARAALDRALALEPERLDARLHRARALIQLGELAAAEADLAVVLEQRPLDGSALFALGDVYRRMGRYDEALVVTEQAVALSPELARGHAAFFEILSSALAARGNRAGAHLASRIAIRHRYRPGLQLIGRGRLRMLTLHGADGQHFSTGQGGALFIGGGNNALENLDSERIAYAPFYVDLCDDVDSWLDKLRGFDAVFNVISDAEAAPGSIPKAETLVAAAGLPVLNRPDRVVNTSRTRIPQVLTGVDNLILPKVVRLTIAGEPKADRRAVHRALAEHGLRFPMILRPLGTHTGIGVVRIDGEDMLARLRLAKEIEEALLIQFVDFRSADGLYRKIRVFFVDGRIMPYHLVMAEHWNIHAANAHEFMTEHPEYQREEQEFLADHRAILGERNLAALAEIRRRIGLDYFGMDFALTEDGRMVLFEANAAMKNNLKAAREQWHYRIPTCERISEALMAMIERRAATSAQPAASAPRVAVGA